MDRLVIGEHPYSESIAYLIVANSLLPFLPRKTCIQGGLCLKIGCLVKKNRRVANARVGDKEGGGREGGGVEGGENLRVGSGPCGVLVLDPVSPRLSAGEDGQLHS